MLSLCAVLLQAYWLLHAISQDFEASKDPRLTFVLDLKASCYFAAIQGTWVSTRVVSYSAGRPVAWLFSSFVVLQDLRKTLTCQSIPLMGFPETGISHISMGANWSDNQQTHTTILCESRKLLALFFPRLLAKLPVSFFWLANMAMHWHFLPKTLRLQVHSQATGPVWLLDMGENISFCLKHLLILFHR